MNSQPHNMAASVHDRLLNGSRARGEDFQFILQRYAAERFLFRLGESKYRDQYVLKGAMLFALWGGSIYRPTRDLDFTGYGENEAEAVVACFREICDLAVSDDGLQFNGSTLTAEPIRDNAEYNGLRVRFQTKLGSARIPMQIDIGFGNAIEPQPCEVKYPTLLNGASPRIRAYPPEAVVAEKLHALVVLGEANTRMKDLYDLYVIASQFDFDGVTSRERSERHFSEDVPSIGAGLPVGLATRFFNDEDRSAKWRSYCDRNTLPGAPRDLRQVGERLGLFLSPVWSALAGHSPTPRRWPAGGPWKSDEGTHE